MKLLDSKIFDAANYILSLIQSRMDGIRQNSFLLKNIDFFIVLSLVSTYIVSAFGTTDMIAMVSIFVPVFVFIKVLITKGEKIELETCNFFLLIYFLICFISNFTSSLPSQSIYGFMKTLMYFAFYFALCQFLKNNKKYIMLIFFVITAIVSIESVIGIMQNIAGVENIATWQDTSYVNPEDVLARVYGTLKPYNPNLFGGYLIAAFPCLLGFCCISYSYKKYKSALIAFIGIIITVITIFQTGCRGAYLALFTIFIGVILASFQMVFFNSQNEFLKKLWKVLMSIFSLMVVSLLFLHHGIFKRIMSIFLLRGDSSTSFRMNVYNSSLQMFQDNWLQGIGVGNKVFREIYGLYMISGFDALSCYCVFLEMAVESGIFSLIAYLLFIGSLLSNAFKNYILSHEYNYKIIVFVSAISILAVMVHGLFDTVYFRPQIQFVFWTMAAILTVMLREEK